MRLQKFADISFLIFSENDDASCSTQLIDGDGEFNVTGIDKFLKGVKLAECGLSYAIVSIMGPQSSGKSTLLNNLFGTNFREMDAFKGRSQTTKGIWLARCVGIEPCTLVMDLEGTDGRERGEDDTAFEKQSALFALAVSDIVLINMWCHDIGREQAANKPLLKTVFQTPLENLEPVLREDIQKIWDSVPKPQAHKDTPLSEFFNVEVVALNSYEEKEELFREQVANLRQRFFHSIAPGGLAGDRRGVVPASGFSFSAQQIWKVIKENKDLDLPAHKVMVATVRCEEIASEKCSDFTQNQVRWIGFNWKRPHNLVLSQVLAESSVQFLEAVSLKAIYFEEGVRTAKRKHLEDKLLQVVQPAFHSILGHVRSEALEKFKEALEKALNGGEGFSDAACRCKQSALDFFDEGCADSVVEHADWDTSKMRSKLVRDLDEHIASVRDAKLGELTSRYEAKLNEALSGPVEALLDSANNETWPSIRNLLKRESQSAVTGLANDLSGFKLDELTQDKMLAKLEDYARGVVEAKAKEEAGKVLLRMKDRFTTLFSRDSDSMPRVWTGKEDLKAITKFARSSSLKLLSVLSAIRLDIESDNIDKTLTLALVENKSNSTSTDRNLNGTDPLASSTWEKVPSSKTLITPVQCKSLWRQFQMETEYTVSQAIAAQEASRRSNNWLPPPWAIAAMVILGFNEFMTLLRNPLYLGVLFVGFLVSKALWVQMDVANEFNHGILPGLLSLCARFVPTVMSLLSKLAAQGNIPATQGGQQNPPPLAANSFRGGVSSGGVSSTGSSHVTRNENGTEYSSYSKDD
ncbi:hypothetical protein KSS87_006919 [Heliosperma pusillum]|nr:hypothetical protein KSS87_006919 [Heliosperma pusillum]